MILGTEVLAIAIGYLLGSLPFAYIVTRLVKGVDIRHIGNGNVGAANVMRQVGIVAGLTVLFLDIAKGLLAVAIAKWLAVPLIFVFIAGFTVVAGHIWPIFLGFRPFCGWNSQETFGQAITSSNGITLSRSAPKSCGMYEWDPVAFRIKSTCSRSSIWGSQLSLTSTSKSAI